MMHRSTQYTVNVKPVKAMTGRVSRDWMSKRAGGGGKAGTDARKKNFPEPLTESPTGQVGSDASGALQPVGMTRFTRLVPAERAALAAYLGGTAESSSLSPHIG